MNDDRVQEALGVLPGLGLGLLGRLGCADGAGSS